MKEHWKGGTLLAPAPPAMVTVGNFDTANIITIAWTGIINTVPPKTYISVRPERYSHKVLSETKEFVINITTTDLVEAADFCGFKSGKDTDKFAACRLSKEKSALVSTPSIAESPLSLECKVTDIIKLGSHDMFLADIVGVSVDKKLIDKNGKLHLDKCDLIAFAHGEYYQLGEKLAKMGFSINPKAQREFRDMRSEKGVRFSTVGKPPRQKEVRESMPTRRPTAAKDYFSKKPVESEPEFMTFSTDERDYTKSAPKKAAPKTYSPKNNSATKPKKVGGGSPNKSKPYSSASKTNKSFAPRTGKKPPSSKS